MTGDFYFKTFSKQDVAKFSGGGGETYYLPKKSLKTYYFLSKKLKNILFWPAKGKWGKCPLLPSPADAHDF